MHDESAPYKYVGEELDVFSHARNWKAYLRRQMSPFLRGRVLEVGAGIGATTEALIRPGVEWTCLEPDPSLHERLRGSDRLRELGHDVEILLGTIEATPVDHYDSVIYVDVLEHIEDDRGELERASARLRPGGHLIVLSPAHQWLFTPFDEALGHFRRYSKATLRRASPSASATLHRLRYLDSFGMIASLGNRLLLHSSSPTKAQVVFWDRRLVPVSRVLDRLLFYGIGKSIMAVWRRK